MAEPPSPSSSSSSTTFRRVGQAKRAYEQVGDQLRELIVSGALAVGDRLPNEVELGEQLGVSRATVREALRVLSAEGLIDTRKGAGGGSFVTRLDLVALARSLGDSLSLLRATDDITAEEVAEARLLLQVAVARGAARHATPEDVARLGELVPTEQRPVDVGAGEFLGEHFHFALADLSGNRLLALALACITSAVKTHVADDPRDPADVRVHTAAIHAGVAAGDPDAAERAMRDYIDISASSYEASWRHPAVGA